MPAGNAQPPKKAPKKKAAKPASKKTAKRKTAKRKTASRQTKPPELIPFRTLAEELGRPVSTIQYWVERDPDCPVRTWDKLPDWRTYSATKVADQDGYGKTLTNLRKEVEVRIKEADLDKKQMELAEARGDLNSQEECSVVLTESFGRLWTEFQRLANTIVNDINREHGSVTKQRQIAQEKIYEIFEQFTLGDWVKKKAFFKILSATFADHQASLLPGSGVKNTSG